MNEQEASRIRELTDALERAEASGRARTDFLARMSHELRTPLHASARCATSCGR